MIVHLPSPACMHGPSRFSDARLPAAVALRPEAGAFTQPVGVDLATVLPDGVGAAVRLAAARVPAGELRGEVSDASPLDDATATLAPLRF